MDRGSERRPKIAIGLYSPMPIGLSREVFENNYIPTFRRKIKNKIKTIRR
jgi:hypothetical protein